MAERALQTTSNWPGHGPIREPCGWPTVRTKCITKPLPDMNWRSTKCENRREELLLARLAEHPEELSARAHIDSLRDQLALAIVKETLRNSFHGQHGVHLPARVEQNGICDFPFRDEGLYLLLFFVRDRQDHQTLPAELLIERVEIGHFFSA